MPDDADSRAARAGTASPRRRRRGRRRPRQYVLTAAAYYPAMVTQDHYFTADPKVASHPRTIRVDPPGPELRARHRPRRLCARPPRLRHRPPAAHASHPIPPGELVDVGCGYGAIAITAGAAQPRRAGLGRRREPPGPRSLRAQRRASRRGQRRARRARRGSRRRSGSPPCTRTRPSGSARRGCTSCCSPGSAGSSPTASATLVVQRHLGADSLAAWLTGLGHRVDRIRSKGGYRVLEVHAAAGTPHHGSRGR